MKHIRRFNQFIVEGYGTNQSINWDLINTAKELTLDYLDEGISLRYIVYYKPETSTTFDVLEGRFSHDGDTFDWNYYDKNAIIDSEDLFYIFWLPLATSDINDSLRSHLREIYPNENIK
jgi:hypothetical protein